MSRPVEYAVAVERFVAAAELGAGSRRVYRIALATWAWSLVDKAPPVGEGRRGATPPTVPLGLLDAPRTAERLREAFRARAGAVGARTANRELSILAAALNWWREQGWLTGDPLSGVSRLPTSAARQPEPRLDAGQVRAVLGLPVPLREKAFWHLLHESGASIERVLALDIGDLDLAGRRSRGRAALHWGEGAAALLPLLTLGRLDGPLFVTGRGRLSYRRAAEVFTAATRPLDPQGRGWTLRRLASAAGPRA
ncbi:hypothetical protein [Actinacidiphila sp. bgisy144]|uniref:hypothetical protein n=1 Tax=Actinacidiphila sp. bgisy144 TaxID=3413791 RepID=UPI003EBEEDEF